MPEQRQYADSLDDPGNVRVQQRHWIGVTPMEIELTDESGRAVPGLASYENGITALAERESACYSGEFPLNRGLYHTGCGGGPEGKGERTSSRSTRQSWRSARATTAASDPPTSAATRTPTAS